jgi:hypothetical protein
MLVEMVRERTRQSFHAVSLAHFSIFPIQKAFPIDPPNAFAMLYQSKNANIALLRKIIRHLANSPEQASSQNRRARSAEPDSQYSAQPYDS